MLSIDSVVVASHEQVSSDLGGEQVILNMRNGVYYGLDEVGARIWQLIQQPRPVFAVRDAILQEYDVAPETCERDVLALLRDLAAAELIEVRGAAAQER